MRVRRRSAPLLLLCLLILQVQVWASQAIGCRHEAGVTATALAPCHAHASDHAAMPSQPSVGSFECHKCALHCLVAPAPIGSSPVLPELPHTQAATAVPRHHYDQFTPSLPERPPRF